MTSKWVFAYGSLIWRPGFQYLERRPALLRGAHRKLCIYSFEYRGTPDRPGLVLGLERGGSCRGVAFRVAAQNWGKVHAYLQERELLNGVYLEVCRPIELDDGVRVPALAYVARRGHKQYAGALPASEQLRLVRQGHGRMGANSDYIINTANHLSKIGLPDGKLDWLAGELAPKKP
ncbi:MAG: gamma-glutamylcyclotransferase [Alphaproteobacteria bacterium]|nr:gamma-glutamylcyclotransferase [Alphaproteobacteria bacterium]